MATEKDYYEILGVAKGASVEEIKKAYRQLARTHHPDMAEAAHKKEAESRFKEINEAYQVLSDADKRRLYDQVGHAAFQQGAGGAGPFSGAAGRWGPFSYSYNSSPSGAEGSGFDFGGFEDPLDIFESVFGFRGFGREGGGQRRRGRNLYYSLTVDFLDAIKGREQEIHVNNHKLKIRIPPGVRDGTEMRYSGEGDLGPAGAPPGDLYLTIRVKPHPKFQRSGDDIYVGREINYAQAVLGDAVEVPVIDPESPTGEGSLKLKIPPATNSGTDFRLKGHGLPCLHGRGRGDVYVRVFIRIPKKISHREKEILEELRSLEIS